MITKVCSDCIKSLQSAKEFKEQCCKTQKTLSEYTKEECSEIDTDFCFYDAAEIEYLDLSLKNQSIEPEDIPENISDLESYSEPVTPAPPVEKVLKRTKEDVIKVHKKPKPLSKLNEVKKRLKQKKLPRSKHVETQCDLCGQIFNNRYKYKHHYEAYHEGKRQKCHICQKEFVSVPTLRRHIAIHLNEKKYKCKFENCNRAYNDITSRSIHYKSHSDERNYVCKICDSAFKHPSSLRSHLLSHTNVRKLECDVCGQGFNEPYKMRDHKLIHTGERPIDCPNCDMMFRCKRQLRVHIRRCH